MPTPRKHAKEIKAWADGTKIQFRIPKAGRLDNQWEDIPEGENPLWCDSLEYRVKPEPKPDIIIEEHVLLHGGVGCWGSKTHYPANARFIFDGETNQLKDVQLIKEKS